MMKVLWFCYCEPL